MLGTPKVIADRMEAWLDAGVSDRFTLQFPDPPEGLDDVVERVIPELQRRGLSAANTKARPCARIWACRGRRTGFLNAKHHSGGIREA